MAVYARRAGKEWTPPRLVSGARTPNGKEIADWMIVAEHPDGRVWIMAVVESKSISNTEDLVSHRGSGVGQHLWDYLRAKSDGIVLEKKAFEGMRFMPGEMLYQIADFSSVWVIADVFEQYIALVKAGARAKVKINAYPGREFEGAITYIYPRLKPETRTIPVRLEIANPKWLLKPAMFVANVPESKKRQEERKALLEAITQAQRLLSGEPLL